MRFYITTAICLTNRGNLEKAQEVMRCMAKSFSEIGRLQEAVEMVFEMRSNGLPFSVHTMNCVLRVAVELDDVGYARKLFDEMSLNGVYPDSCSFKTMIAGYCRGGRTDELEKLFKAMEERGFCIDNSTCTLMLNVFAKKGLFNKAVTVFRKMCDMGLSPNVINYTALIDGLCKKGSVKQAFQVLEEMVERGIKPNVYTHTTLISGLCKIGWTERAFRLFLKLPNVNTYTAMIGGYSEMLLARMREQGLTYTTLITAYSRQKKMEEVFEKMMKDGCVADAVTYGALINLRRHELSTRAC
ncbi:Pentatricopeptide repeat-containing protein [Ananas comosus]|uniref:Pentatricopeptide repeat-containing protein n=1 Tax=Ananas comosus TaxID=4615 RepID=A0A199W981_ANACO|nr:Pentatricopeptide repeat-containing protein [Ananas comosus]